MTVFASIPAQAQDQQAQNQVVYRAGGACATTQAAYNQCFELSQARGVSEQRAKAETWFIYQCLKGKIPKGSQ